MAMHFSYPCVFIKKQISKRVMESFWDQKIDVLSCVKKRQSKNIIWHFSLIQTEVWVCEKHSEIIGVLLLIIIVLMIVLQMHGLWVSRDNKDWFAFMNKWKMSVIFV